MQLTKEETQELTQLLEQQWSDAGMVKHCLANSAYIKLDDNFIDCGDKKPSIDRDMWYDDETDGPDDSKFEAFRAYNIRMHALPELKTVSDYMGPREIWLTTQYYSDRTNGRLLGVTTKHVDHPAREQELREVTPEELKLINQARQQVNDRYEQRLKTYWKRYADKVTARGYWANR